MSGKKIAIGIAIVVVGGLGLFALWRWHHDAAAPDDEATPPPIVDVQLGQVKRATLHRYLSGYGTVAAAPAAENEPAADAPLAAPVAGVIARINVFEGGQVKRGDVLMELNSSGMMLDYAEREVERQRKLFAQNNTSRRDLQTAEDHLALLQVVAPFSGTVTRVNVQLGAAVDANTVVAEVMDLDRLIVEADFPAADAGELKTGQPVQLLVQSPTTAAISFISPTVNTNNGTVRVRARLAAGSALRPGQFLRLRVVTGVQTNCLAAPRESVVTDLKGRSVIALVKGDEAIQTAVQTGFHENGLMEIKADGLKAGDSVVTVGAYGLPKKTKIRVVNASADDSSPTGSPTNQ